MKAFNKKADELTIDDLKEYLRIDYDYDDNLLTTILYSSKSFVQTYLNKRFQDYKDKNIEIPEEFTIACLSICAHWYENRAIDSERLTKEASYTFAGILDMHRDWLD